MGLLALVCPTQSINSLSPTLLPRWVLIGWVLTLNEVQRELCNVHLDSPPLSQPVGHLQPIVGFQPS